MNTPTPSLSKTTLKIRSPFKPLNPGSRRSPWSRSPRGTERPQGHPGSKSRAEISLGQLRVSGFGFRGPRKTLKPENPRVWGLGPEMLGWFGVNLTAEVTRSVFCAVRDDSSEGSFRVFVFGELSHLSPSLQNPPFQETTHTLDPNPRASNLNPKP